MYEGDMKQSSGTGALPLREVWKRGEREFEAMMRQLDAAVWFGL